MLCYNTVYRVMRCENCTLLCIKWPCLMPSVDSVDIYSIWWYGWKALSLSFPKLFLDWKLVEILRKLWAGMCGCVLTVASTVSTNIAFSALYALIFISTVLTNKIPYSIHNSIALIFCINCLNMPFNVHSNYNVDSNTKTLNYMKIRFKALIYFELQETSK